MASSAAQAWFLTLLGQHVKAETAAARATTILRSTEDPVALLLALQCWAISLAYSYRLEEWIAAVEEGMVLNEKIESLSGQVPIAWSGSLTDRP